MSFINLDISPPATDFRPPPSADCEYEYCRLCATKFPPHLLQRFSSEETSDHLLTSIRRLNVSINGGDGLPQTVCKECVRLLQAVEVIVRKIANAQKTLAGLLQRVNQFTEATFDLKSDHSHSGNEGSDVGDDTGKLIEQKSKKNRKNHLKQTKTHKKRKKAKSNITLPMYNRTTTDDSVKAEPDLCTRLSMLPLYNNVPTTTNEDDVPVKSEDPTILRWSDFFCCKRCNLKTQSLQQLREHSWQIHKRCVIFKCVTCPGQIISYKRFFRHMIKHHSSLEQCCEFCNECFVSSSEVRFHKRQEHTDEAKPHPCNSCGTTFDHAEELQSHRDCFIIVKAKVAGNRRFKCPQCDKEFLNKVTLQSHLENHDPTKNYCVICNKTYKNKYNLKQHMSFVHNPQSQFICQICGKSFKRGAMLKEHIAIHKGIRPFSCAICEKKFSKSAALKSHQVSHSGLRPCVCKVCGKSYKFKSGLNLHLNTHENVKPYSCDICIKSFQNWSNYNKHMKRIHNKNMSMRQVLEQC